MDRTKIIDKLMTNLYLLDKNGLVMLLVHTLPVSTDSIIQVEKHIRDWRERTQERIISLKAYYNDVNDKFTNYQKTRDQHTREEYRNQVLEYTNELNKYATEIRDCEKLFHDLWNLEPWNGDKE